MRRRGNPRWTVDMGSRWATSATRANTHIQSLTPLPGESVPELISQRRYSGKFMVRVPPEVHRKLAIEAAEEDISLNRLVSNRGNPPAKPGGLPEFDRYRSRL